MRMTIIIHAPVVLVMFIFYKYTEKMGQAPSATNVVDENVSAIASVVNDAVQNCGQEVNQDIAQFISLNNTDIGGDLRVNANNSLVLKEGCLQSEQASTQLDQALQSTASQTAQAIAQQFGFLSSAKAKNVIDINAQIASEIKNNFVQICANQTSQSIQQDIKLSDDQIGGSVIINAKNYQQELVECSTQGSTIQRLKDQLTIQISQQATAKVENFFMPFFIALLVVVGLIALFLFLPALFRKKEPARAPATASSGSSVSTLLADLGEGGGGGVSGAATPTPVSGALSGTTTPTPASGRLSQLAEKGKGFWGQYGEQIKSGAGSAGEKARGFLSKYGGSIERGVGDAASVV